MASVTVWSASPPPTALSRAISANKLNHVSPLDRVVAQDFDAGDIDMCLVGMTVMSLRRKFDGAGVVHSRGPLKNIEMVGTPVAILSLAFWRLRRILGADH